MDEKIRLLLDLPEDDCEFFERLRQAVARGNRRMNLTRLTEPWDFFLKHVLDSWLPFRVVPALRDLKGRRMVADLGSGAGFPGLVVARLRPKWEVALIERTKKKAAFLEETRDELGLENVYVVPLDAREAARQVPALRHGCHLVLARAVGRIAVVAQAAEPLMRPGGMIVHYKGGRPDPQEVAAGKIIAPKLHLTLEAPVHFELPPDAGRTVFLNRSRRRRRGGPFRRRASGKSRGGRAR